MAFLYGRNTGAENKRVLDEIGSSFNPFNKEARFLSEEEKKYLKGVKQHKDANEKRPNPYFAFLSAGMPASFGPTSASLRQGPSRGF